MEVSAKIILLALCWSVLITSCKEKATNSISNRSVNEKKTEKDLAAEKWLKVEQLIKYGDIKDSADFMNKVNAIMSVHDHKRTSFTDRTLSVDGSGSFNAEIRMVTFGRLKNVRQILPGDKDYEASMSNMRGDNSTLNIRLLFKELSAGNRPLWRCIILDRWIAAGTIRVDLDGPP